MKPRFDINKKLRQLKEILSKMGSVLIVRRKLRKRILSFFKKLGYVYVTVDLEGYWTGSINEVVK